MAVSSPGTCERTEDTLQRCSGSHPVVSEAISLRGINLGLYITVKFMLHFPAGTRDCFSANPVRIRVVGYIVERVILRFWL